jgi:2-polyprenyl-6-methoxyphenol hydroxylase-like FAD-dependent oxidoreductase
MWRHDVAAVSSGEERAYVTVNKLRKKFRKDPAAADSVYTEWVAAKRSDIEVDFVLGADGHNSAVRRALAVDFPEVGPAQYYAIFEFKSNEFPSAETRIVLGERTTDVLWPLPDGYWRWSFQLPDYSDTEAEQLKDRLLSAGFGHFPTKRVKDRVPATVEWGVPPALTQEHLEELIAERAPWFTGSIANLSWRTIVRFEKRLASRFGEGRIWLAGDSAHLALPVGVQSMNLGLLEANDLAGVFARIIAGEAPAVELEGYNQRWTATWRQLHGLQGGLRATSGTDPWIRDRADRLMACLPAHGAALEQLAAQLGLEVSDDGGVGQVVPAVGS